MENKLDFNALIPELDETMISIEPIVEPTPIESANPDDAANINDTPPDTNPADTNVQPSNDNTHTNDDEPSNDLSTLFFKELVKNNIAQENEEKENYTWDDVNSVIDSFKEDLPKEITNQIVDSVPDLGKDLIDFVFTKGDSLSKKDLSDFYKTYLEDLDVDSMTIEDNISARTYLTEKYKSKGIGTKQIDIMLDALEDDVDNENALTEEAKRFLEEDRKNKKSKEVLTNTKEQQNKLIQEQRQFANKLNEEFNSLNWDSKRVTQVKNNLLNGKTNQILGIASTHPKALIQLADFAEYFDEAAGSFDFSKFIEKQQSKTAASLKDRITQDMFNSANKSKETIKNPNAKKDFDSWVPVSPITR